MNELTIYDKIQDPMLAIEKFGEMIEKSNMFGCQKGQGAMVALMCIVEKTTPLKIFQKYHIVQNRFTMRSDRMLAELIDAGGKYKWINTGDDGKKATLFIELNGVSGETTFTIEDAKKAKLIKEDGGWTKYPSAMLRARVVSAGMRMYAPTIVAGIYTPEEIQDIEIEDTPKNNCDLLTKKQNDSNKKEKELENFTENNNTKDTTQNGKDTKENNECIDKHTVFEVETKNIPVPVETNKEKNEHKEDKIESYKTYNTIVDIKQLINTVKDMYGEKTKYLVTMLTNRGVIEKGKDIDSLNETKLKTLIECYSSYIKHVDKLIEKENSSGTSQVV